MSEVRASLVSLNLSEVIKALIFASGDGINIEKIYEELETNFDRNEITENIKVLESEFSGKNGLILIRYGKKIQFQTNPKYGEVISDALLEIREKEISKTLLQVLAIIAYKQPITKAEIEQLRGQSPDYAIMMLLKLNLIMSVGRKESIGRPILYGTTDEFLRKFGLQSISMLPDYDSIIDEIRNKYDVIFEENKLFKSKSSEEKEELLEDDSIVQVPDFLSGEDYIQVD